MVRKLYGNKRGSERALAEMTFSLFNKVWAAFTSGPQNKKPPAV